MANLLYIGNKLANKGKTVTSIETLGRFLKAEGFTVFTASSKKNKVLRLLDMLFCTLKYKGKADYVLIDTYSTTNFYYAYAVSRLCRFLQLKYIPILRGGNLPNRLKSSPKLSKSIFSHAFVNVAPSHYTQSNFEAMGYSKIICIPNSIQIKNYPFKKRNFKKAKLLWVRSFSKIYNPLLAIQLLKALIDDGIEAELCMVGADNDGSLNQARNYAKALKVKVTFTGKLEKRAWIDLSKHYNIFINTTNFDNMPVSVIEAMALGLPIVSTNVGGLPYLIENNKDGILVNPNDASVFKSAIKTLINNSEKAELLVTNARKKVECFDWEVVKNQWIKLLE